MFKVLIFGTGVNMQKMINYINYEKVNIVAFVDNDVNKIGKKIREKIIISPADIKNYDYDFIIIASLAYREISEQLLNLNVNKEKIVQLYNGSFTLGETILFNDEVVYNKEICELFTSIEVARFDWNPGGRNQLYDIREEIENYYSGVEVKNIRNNFKLLIWFVDSLAGRNYANQVIEGCKKGGFDFLSIFDIEEKRVWNNELDFLRTVNEYKPSAIFVNLIDTNKMPFEIPNNLPVFSWVDGIVEQFMFLEEKYFENIHKYNILCCPYLKYDDKLSDRIKSTNIYKNNMVNFPFVANKSTFKKWDITDEEKIKYSSDVAMVLNFRGIEGLYYCWGMRDEKFSNSFIGNRMKDFIALIYEEVFNKINIDEKPIDDIVYCKEIVKKMWNKVGLNKYIILDEKLVEKYGKLVLMKLAVIAYYNIIPKWLSERNYNFKIYGANWDKVNGFRRYVAGEIKDGKTLSKIYQLSKIIVDVNYLVTVHRRTFENILSDSFVLLSKVDKVNYSNIDLFFEEDKNIVTYSSKKELYEKLDYYLENEEERKAITKAAQKVVEDNKLYADEVFAIVIEQAIQKLENIAQKD